MNALCNWLTWRQRPFVLLNLKGHADAIHDVLWERRGEWLRVKSPRLLRAGGEEVPADGEILVHLNEVQFVQVLPGAPLTSAGASCRS
jgi:hypothetical protein